MCLLNFLMNTVSLAYLHKIFNGIIFARYESVLPNLHVPSRQGFVVNMVIFNKYRMDAIARTVGIASIGIEMVV